MKNSEYAEYSSKLGFVETAIKSLKNSGGDTLEFQTELNTITESVAKAIDDSKDSTSLSADDKNNLVIKSYCDATVKLDNLITKINQFSLYFQALTTFNSVYNAQNIYDIDENNLSNVIEELIATLELIKSMTLINENKSLEAFYGIIYDVIKMECRVNGTSKLLDHCKTDNSDSAHISKLIIEDIDILKYESKDFSEIEKKISKLNFADGERMYLNDNLVWLISIGGDKEKFTKHLTEQIKKLTYELNHNNNNGFDLTYSVDNLNYELDRNKRKVEEAKRANKKAKFKSYVPLILTVAQLGINVACIVNSATTPVYITTTETYSSETNQTNIETKYDKTLKDENSQDIDSYAELKVYEPWKNYKNSKYIRLVETTSIPVEEYESLKSMDTIDLDKLGYNFTTDEEKTSRLNLDEIYEQPKFEITKVVQDENSKTTRLASGDIEQIKTVIWLTAIYTALYCSQLLLARSNTTGTFGLINSIKFIRKAAKKIKEDDGLSKETQSLLDQIDTTTKQLEEIINLNKKNNDRFSEIALSEDNRLLLEKVREGTKILGDYSDEFGRSEELESEYKKIL